MQRADEPFPEELHRRLIGQVATLHFAPTAAERSALIREGVPQCAIHVTGNSGIDALHLALRRIDGDPQLAARLQWRFGFLSDALPLLLATIHRRENLNERLRLIAGALAGIARSEPVALLVAMHRNPNVRQGLMSRLGRLPNVHLTEALDDVEFIHQMRRARLVLTDSGGVQEEAPALGCPVLRGTIERQQGLQTGDAKLLPFDVAAIRTAVHALLHDPAAHRRMTRAGSPYDDGRAAAGIVAAIAHHLSPVAQAAGRPME